MDNGFLTASAFNWASISAVLATRPMLRRTRRFSLEMAVPTVTTTTRITTLNHSAGSLEL